MSENKDLNEIIENIESIDEQQEVDLPLFQNMKVETPFKHEETPTVERVSAPKFDADDEGTVIGVSTNIDSNVVCGGNIEVKGVINGNLTVNGHALVYGSINGNFEANEITLESTAKIVGDVSNKSDLILKNGSSIIGNVTTKNGSIASFIQGNVFVSSELKLSSTASIEGDITTGSLSVDSGAVINGKISIKK